MWSAVEISESEPEYGRAPRAFRRVRCCASVPRFEARFSVSLTSLFGDREAVS